MGLTVYLDCEATLGTEEVENIGAGWMLAAEA